MTIYEAEQQNIYDHLAPIQRAAHALTEAITAVRAAEDRCWQETADPAPETPTSDTAVLALDQVLVARVALATATDALVRDARARGATWTRIAHALGVSPQAVQQRYGTTDQETQN